MTPTLWACAALLVWTVAGIWWFIANIGNKHGGPDPWWVYVLSAPLMLLIYIVTAPMYIKRWYHNSWPFQRPRQARGRVDLGGIQYTWGQGGHQWTTIDGVRYATYWNALDIDWKEGWVVDFEVYWDWVHLGANRREWVKHARNIKAA